MSFNNLGPITSIAPGQKLFWWFSYGGDRGAQYGAPDIKTPGAELVADDQSKKIEDNGSVTYFCSIRNTGPFACLHNLQGGGFV